MRKRLVRIRHAVRIVLLLHAIPFTLARRNHLSRQLLRHALLAALTRILHEPSHPQRRPTLGPHFHRHLVRRPTHSATLHLDHRLDVLQRSLEHVHARLPRARLDEIHRAVENSLGRRLLALEHQRVDELRNGLAIVAGVGKNRTLHRFRATAHFLPPAAPAFGFLVPYFDRLWLRPLTPEASNVPRTMW